MDNEKQKLAQLVIRYRNGDQSAFNELYEFSYMQAFFTASKICKNEDDAEDVLQEAYLLFTQKADDIENPEAFMSWFNQVVANKSKNLLRKKNPLLFKDEEEENFVLDSIKDEDDDYRPGEDVEQSELKQDVMELVDALNDEKRTAIMLFYYDKMTTKEIAESLGVNENTVKSRLVQAKKDLAKGVKELEKKNKSLFGVAPISLVIWALKNSAQTSGEAFVASGGAAATLATINAASAGVAVATSTTAVGTAITVGATATETVVVAGTASAGTVATGGIVAKVAGVSIAKKIVAGVVVAGVVTGGAAGTKSVIDHKKQEALNAEVSMTENIDSTTASTTVRELVTEAESTKRSTTVSTSTTSTSVTLRSTSANAVTSTTAKQTTTKATTTTTTTKAEKVSLNVQWVSYSGDGKSGNYTVEVDKGTTISESMVTERLLSPPNNYAEADIISGNGNIGITADNSDYNFEVYVS